MMGQQGENRAKLFYEFCLEDRVPVDHVLRKTDRFLDLRALRQELARFYWSSPGLVDTHARLSSQEDGV